MKSEASSQGDKLASALRSLGINFVLVEKEIKETIHNHPTRLIKALAQSNEARLRLSLIPLFLDHPEFSKYVSKAANQLEPMSKITLQCYYSAAMLFQKKFDLNENLAALPDLFSIELGIEFLYDTEESLEILAERHKVLSEMQINWLGTYKHAALIWERARQLQRN